MSLIEMRVLMYKRKISTKQLAGMLGISYIRMSRKLDGDAEFTSNEIESLADILGKREVAFIFFGNE